MSFVASNWEGRLINGRLGGQHGLLPFVDVYLGQPGALAGPFKALVDTGADGLYVLPAVAQRAGLVFGGPALTAVPGGQRPGNVAAGDMAFANAAPPLPTISFYSVTLDPLPEGADVLLGMGILRHFHMTFRPDGTFTIHR